MSACFATEHARLAVSPATVLPELMFCALFLVVGRCLPRSARWRPCQLLVAAMGIEQLTAFRGCSWSTADWRRGMAAVS